MTRTAAVAYLRTSSATNVGFGKDSDDRQRDAIASYARHHRIDVVREFYDAAVSGADPVHQRPGFVAMLEYMAGNGARTVLVEAADRFARDLAVQLTGHQLLRDLGYDLIAVNAPTHFLEDTPTAEMVRQILGSVAQFEKTSTVQKLRRARDAHSERRGYRLDHRPPLARTDPDVVAFVQAQARRRKSAPTVAAIARQLAEMGCLNSKGKPFSQTQVRRMIDGQKVPARSVEEARDILNPAHARIETRR